MLTVNSMHLAPLVFDMRKVAFVNPYGALLLLATSRNVTDITGYRVRLDNLRNEVHAYLERMNLFIEGTTWLYSDDSPVESFSRSPSSWNLLEITRLTAVAARMKFQARARNVLNTWIAPDLKEINEIITVLSEICNNAAEHSEDQGHVMIQSYRHQAFVEVDIVVIDLGIGIKGSLSNRHDHSASSDIDYINLALSGYSARGEQEGGAGLKIVQKHIAKRQGELAIRSGKGLIAVDSDGTSHPLTTYAFPGTQVCLKLRGYRTLT